MVICIILASVMAFFSIFAFFGDAFSNTGGTAIPSMFKLMFGGTGVYSGYEIKWNLYGVLTFLFVFQICIMINAVAAVYIAYRAKVYYEKEKGVFVSICLGIMSLVALIISFCTLEITDIDPNNYGVKLGAGPIMYSIMHIFVILILSVGISIYYYQRNKYYSQLQTHARNDERLANSDGLAKGEGRIVSKKDLSENEKIDLLLRYKKMLDDNIITQEEFDKKKKELL